VHFRRVTCLLLWHVVQRGSVRAAIAVGTLPVYEPLRVFGFLSEEVRSVPHARFVFLL
jgi:hypothetical protein